MQISINTRLDAINHVLGCLGLAPVDSEDEYNLDVAQAAMIIDNISRQMQTNKGYGWWFNREENWLMTPDPNSKQVVVPNNTLAVYYIDRYKRQQRMATRGLALYDPKLHRFDMTTFADTDGKMNLTLVVQLEFDDLPFTLKDAIAKAAGMRFARSNEMDRNRLEVLKAEADDAYFAVEAEDSAQRKNNAFKDNPAMVSFDVIGGGYNNWI